MKLIDLSQKIEQGMPVYPGDTDIILEHINCFAKDNFNNHRLDTGMHVGTHIDGRMHMLDVEEYICDIPLESFCGKGCIIRTHNKSVLTAADININILKQIDVVLINTGMDKYYGTDKYYTEHPVIDISLCQRLVEHNIKLVGFDSPSPDRLPFQIHKYLLSNNVLIMENLTNLDKINDYDRFEVFAFPLKLRADSCMVRAVAKILSLKE